MNGESEHATPVYSIGYGQRPWAEVVALLRRYEIAYLIDVRSAPYSKFRPEMSKRPLAAATQAAGFTYAWWGGALGGRPDDPALIDADGHADYAAMRARDEYRGGIARLARASADGHRACLLCGCLRPGACHRHGLLGPSLAAAGIPYRHIMEDGSAISDEELKQALSGGQEDLFG